ncbi:WD repeat-containing protein 33 [Dispira simplex]|nr:WD repeat-containing protein 33 [Dispira simplex]
MDAPLPPMDFSAPRRQFDGKQIRGPVKRRTLDYTAGVARSIETRIERMRKPRHWFTRIGRDYIIDLLTPAALPDSPVSAVAAHFVHTSVNKARCPINVVRWYPDGRRLTTGSSRGEFTLWNGLSFNFETLLQAHDSAVRVMEWSHNSNWLVTADHTGVIKYWQSNMNNLKMFQGHKEAIRGLSFSPSDMKFATCSDDRSIKIWNFNEGQQERELTGHGWDVRCVDWHPYKGLLASGGKDNTIRLWDPKTRDCLNTFYGHKSTIMGLKWNRNGHWLGVVSREQVIKLYDIRTMKEMQTLRGHKKDVTTFVWHPIHERLFATGGYDGTLFQWLVDQPGPVSSMEVTPDYPVWSIDWHPAGHLLAVGSNDHTTRFYSRYRPDSGVKVENQHLPNSVEEALAAQEDEPTDTTFVPGLSNLRGGLGQAPPPPPPATYQTAGNGKPPGLGQHTTMPASGLGHHNTGSVGNGPYHPSASKSLGYPSYRPPPLTHGGDQHRPGERYHSPPPGSRGHPPRSYGSRRSPPRGSHHGYHPYANQLPPSRNRRLSPPPPPPPPPSYGSRGPRRPRYP